MIQLQNSTNSDFNYISKMEVFGFTKAECAVYVYLLERGVDLGVSKIAVGTKLHRQHVYIALPKLLEEGFIEASIVGKHSKYRAKPPIVLEKFAKKNVFLAEDLARNLEKISKIDYQQDFEIITGKDACVKFELERAESMSEGEDQYIIGSSSDGYLEMMGEAYNDKFVPILERKKIKTYYLAPDNQSNRSSIMDSRQPFYVRVFKGLSAGPLVTMVEGDNLIFYVNVYPTSIYVIKSKKVAEGYRQFFLTLWESVSGKD